MGPILRSYVEICLEIMTKTIKAFMVVSFSMALRIHCPPKQIKLSNIITGTALDIHRAVVDHLRVIYKNATLYSVLFVINN